MVKPVYTTILGPISVNTIQMRSKSGDTCLADMYLS